MVTGKSSDTPKHTGYLTHQHIRNFTGAEERGSGQSGVVRKARSGTRVIAVKTMQLNSGDESLSLTEAEKIVTEVQICKKLSHRHIVRYLGSIVEEDTNELHLFIEWMPVGSLKNHIDDCGGIGLVACQKYAGGIASGLEYLHLCGVCHLDLKPANILVDQDGTVKLADFGTSRQTVNGASFKNTAAVKIRGTIPFMAPEVCRSESQGFYSDVWSFGCTLLNLVNGRLPWAETGIREPLALLFHIGAQAKVGPACLSSEANADPQFCELLEKCFNRDPKARPSIRTLRLMNFFLAPSPRNRKTSSRMSIGCTPSSHKLKHASSLHSITSSSKNDSAARRNSSRDPFC